MTPEGILTKANLAAPVLLRAGPTAFYLSSPLLLTLVPRIVTVPAVTGARASVTAANRQSPRQFGIIRPGAAFIPIPHGTLARFFPHAWWWKSIAFRVCPRSDRGAWMQLGQRVALR